MCKSSYLPCCLLIIDCSQERAKASYRAVEKMSLVHHFVFSESPYSILQASKILSPDGCSSGRFGRILSPVSPSSSVNSPCPLPVLVPSTFVFPQDCFPRAIGTCGQQPSHKLAKYKPPQTASEPLWLSAPLSSLLSSQIKLQRRLTDHPCWAGPVGCVCLTGESKQTKVL